eukprot:1880264-Rhodomonas_salina.1
MAEREMPAPMEASSPGSGHITRSDSAQKVHMTLKSMDVSRAAEIFWQRLSCSKLLRALREREGSIELKSKQCESVSGLWSTEEELGVTGEDDFAFSGTRGPRIGQDGKVLARSILGDPSEFETLYKDPSRRQSESSSPTHASGAGRARFASNASFASIPGFDMNLP